ncbi:hypothetical protein ACFGVR_11700 [Mucilaginibacter sp. AW1-3]
MKKILCVVGFFMLCSITAYSQKKDTIYYLFDTVHTAPNDRMIRIVRETLGKNTYVNYSIQCACLAYGNMPLFSSNSNKATNINKATFKTLKFIQITHLIELVKTHDNATFNDNYDVFFIEPAAQNYVVRRVLYMPGREPLQGDYGTSRPKKP